MSDPDRKPDGSAPGAGPSSGGGDGAAPQAAFLTLVSTLAMQATIQLGLVQHPVTKKTTKDLRQARFAIDTIAMLERKTRGNLTDEEQQVLAHILTDLRLKYVEAQK